MRIGNRKFVRRKNLPWGLKYAEELVLGEEDWNALMEHLKNPPKPTQALIDLFKEYEGSNNGQSTND
jgi:hypothetical protein